jgi:hypothetical protein
MAKTKKPLPVKLIVGAIFASEGVLIQARRLLAKRFGPLDFESGIFSFDCTDYYEQEMGPGLKRRFLSFKRLINPASLSAIKLYTNKLEERLSRDRSAPQRKINLDPGYISASKLVLATCKNYSHRIYLDKGIYAEVTLQFHKGTFCSFPWTYRDYKTQGYIQAFNAIREAYLRQLKQ